LSNFDKNRFASNKQEYATPLNLFKVLDNEFRFTLDVCADSKNTKVKTFYSKEDDSLSKEWLGTCWMNPPYKDMKKWVIKAYNESIKNNAIIVCLIPARTNTVWWHDYCMKGEIRFIKGRPKFEGCIHGLPQPLAIVVFGLGYSGNYKSVVF
jgi:phage N-6-adenine-methyltransferase